MPTAINSRLFRLLHPKRIHRSLLFHSLLISFVLFPSFGSSQLIPEAPVRNFRLPMFGEDGYRIWDLRGEEGRYLNENQIDVTGMYLRVFSGDETDLLETQIRSPKATVLIRSNEARGDDSIWVRGSNFQVTGTNWLWQRTNNRILIENSVKVTFFEELDSLLR